MDAASPSNLIKSFVNNPRSFKEEGSDLVTSLTISSTINFSSFVYTDPPTMHDCTISGNFCWNTSMIIFEVDALLGSKSCLPSIVLITSSMVL